MPQDERNESTVEQTLTKPKFPPGPLVGAVELHLFSPVPYDVDPQRTSDGRSSKITRRKLALLSQGLHPVTKLPLLDEGATTCGDCAHLTRYSRAKDYLKCELLDTRSESTDTRRWYPSCIAFEPAIAESA